MDTKVLAKVAKYVKANPVRLALIDNDDVVEIWATGKDDKARLGSMAQPLADIFGLLFKTALKSANIKTTRYEYKLPVAAPKKVAVPLRSAKTTRAALGTTKRPAKIPARKRAANGRKKVAG